MSPLRRVALLFPVIFAAFLGEACSSDDAAAPAEDAGSDGPGPTGSGDGQAPGDAGNGPVETGPEEPFASATEVEPNDGQPADAIGQMTIPGEMKGSIDPANDIDIFAVKPSPGELWEWTLAPSGAALAPHLTLFDTAADNMNPTVLASGAASATAKLEHFVLHGGSFVAAVRDARNVPSPQGHGGPTFGYTLTARRMTRAPVPVSLPGTKSGKLASLSSVDLYEFTGNQGTGFDIVLRAKRKAGSSTLDSRMSLFDATGKVGLLTNDDAAGTTDSEIGGTLPRTGRYVVIVENEGTDGADLSYEIELSVR
jgi:hypothetical protein